MYCLNILPASTKVDDIQSNEDCTSEVTVVFQWLHGSSVGNTMDAKLSDNINSNSFPAIFCLGKIIGRSHVYQWRHTYYEVYIFNPLLG